ncbi:epididymal-specific lipocalin-6 isoform X5 [Bubalus bubalis]|uniref:epididymal-specific lipocalin-6 isoform X5 n=1 Tax=Bubalus bubalis TaxID=89462 RepID=UPI001D107EA9|nr:epididymal-specific lipocalin-6 isoform X5 [Bubalus bubalis]
MLILETSKWRAAGEARVEGAPHTVPAPPCSPARLEDQERGRREPGDECRPHHCVQSHINGRPEAGGPLSPGPGRLLACGPREMRAVLLAALLAVVLVPSAQAVWLGRLDPQQVAAPPHRCGPGATRVLGPLWSPGSPGAPRTMGAAGGRAGGGGTAPHLRPLPQLMGSWYVLAVASGEKDFALEKATKSVEGVAVMLASQSTLKMRASRHRLERCHLQAVELRRQNSRWVFGNPSLGVLEYRVLGTNFRDYAIVFTQLEAQEEAFSTVELYSRTALASREALGRFAKWSRSLGFLSQQQAELQRDFLRLLVRPCCRLRCPGDAAARRPEEAGRIRGAGSGGGPAEGGARLEPVPGVPDTLANPAERQEEAGVQEHLEGRGGLPRDGPQLQCQRGLPAPGPGRPDHQDPAALQQTAHVQLPEHEKVRQRV